MFTGIIEAVGRLARSESRGGDVRIRIDSESLSMTDVALGDSIAVSGVCLTVVAFDQGGFEADVSRETLSRTSLGQLPAGAAVNLEKALLASARLGGHLVSGHVDGLVRVLSIEADARSQRWKLELPSRLSRYVAAKGSVCLDGVSLTVNQVAEHSFSVNLVPHTVAQTNFGERKAGDVLNLEVDLIARYLERLLIERGQGPELDLDRLRQSGFA